MKPPRFEYEAPETVEQAIGLLAELGDEAKVLAGGQSFVPMLNLRLARPGTVVDIRKLPLDYLRVDDEQLRVGALVKHKQLETDPLVAAAANVYAQAAPHIGYISIRNRGTFGGSLAHADSTAEISLCSLAMGATVIARSTQGEREIPIEEFFLGPFTTALEPEELLTEARVPRMTAGDRHGFAELARRSGDFALAAAAVVIPRDEGDIRISVVGPGPTPQLVVLPGDAKLANQSDLEGLADEAVAELGGMNESMSDLEKRSAKAVVVDALMKATNGGEE